MLRGAYMTAEQMSTVTKMIRSAIFFTFRQQD
jgi:hypothetical protein